MVLGQGYGALDGLFVHAPRTSVDILICKVLAFTQISCMRLWLLARLTPCRSHFEPVIPIAESIHAGPVPDLPIYFLCESGISDGRMSDLD